MSTITICDICKDQVAKVDPVIKVDTAKTTGYTYHIHWACLPEDLLHLSFVQDRERV